jgi:hypothetical protein
MDITFMLRPPILPTAPPRAFRPCRPTALHTAPIAKRFRLGRSK